MWQIAGGIILAVAILAFWPVIAGVGVLLLIAALAIGGAFLIFGTEQGRELGLFFGGFILGIMVLAQAGKLLRNLARKLINNAKDAGGWDILIRKWIFELRPAITERQKIQKIARRDERREENRKLKSFREGASRKRIEKRQRELETASERRYANALATHKDRVARRVRRLEQKFAHMGQLHFDYSDAIEIYRQNDEGFLSEKIVRLNFCLVRPSYVGSDFYLRCYYELQTAPRFGYEATEKFLDKRSLIKSVRKILRRAAAETIAHEPKAEIAIPTRQH